MKRMFICLIALTIIILPLCVSFAETDDAVGLWYCYYDFSVYPELKSNFGDYDSVFLVYCFLENGTIIEMSSTMNNENIEQKNVACGKWEKKGTEYNYSIVGVGEGSFVIDNEDIWLSNESKTASVRFRKIIAINPYVDYKR